MVTGPAAAAVVLAWAFSSACGSEGWIEAPAYQGSPMQQQDAGGDGLPGPADTGPGSGSADAGTDSPSDPTTPGTEPDPPDDPTPQPPFSFFVTSLQAMRLLSGSQDGFGGDLGGLAGADTICQRAASAVGAGGKTWRAFLSVTEGPDGDPVHAIDRVGTGPWYDRNGRLVAQNLAGLTSGDRPGGDPQVVDDLPDELGVPLSTYGDSHDVLTGSNEQGRLRNTDPVSTCYDWTSAVGSDTSGVVTLGHAWPANSGRNWIKAHTARGCAAGVNLIQDGGGSGDCVGCSGGWGALYCFALTP